MRYSKVIVLLVVVLNVAFAAAVFWLIYATGVEPVALISAWFAWTTGELAALAIIKRTEIKTSARDADISNNKEEKE
jgi:hypothetical protein